jgi:hypothetical protein
MVGLSHPIPVSANGRQPSLEPLTSRPNGPGEPSLGLRPKADAPGKESRRSRGPEGPRDLADRNRAIPAEISRPFRPHGFEGLPDPGYRPSASTLGFYVGPVVKGLGVVKFFLLGTRRNSEAALSVPSGACQRARTWSSLPASIRADHNTHVAIKTPNAACAASDSGKLSERPHLKLRFGSRTKPRAGHAPPVGSFSVPPA